MEAFDNRLAKWKEKSLSIGRRLTLLKLVLESLPTYFFPYIKLPKKSLIFSSSKEKNLLGGRGNDGVAGISWVVWDLVTKPKKAGGLGLTPLRDFNITFFFM